MPSVSAGYAPDLEKYLRSLKGHGQSLEASVESLVSLLKRRQIKGSEACAVATSHILVQVVARSRWHDVDGLIDNVSRVGRRLVEAQPRELVTANIVRRVLGLIRDEAAEDRGDAASESQSDVAADTPTETLHSSTYTKQDSAGDYLGGGGVSGSSPKPPLNRAATMATSYSTVNAPKTLFHLLSSPNDADAGGAAAGSSLGASGASTPSRRPGGGNSAQIHALRSEVINGIEEIKDEIGQVDDQIAALAEVQIHPGDYILVHQPSPTTERFILRAALKRKFTVLMAIEPSQQQRNQPPQPGAADDGGPHAPFRAKLGKAGITVINIMNGGLMGYMSRVDKVILGAHAVVASGGVVADAGAAAVARAAKEQGNAVIVLSGVYKLSPENPFNEESLIEWADSSSFVNFADGAMVRGVEVRTALTELVPPELIDTYITNLGTHSRDHLSSLIADHYKQEDVDFHLYNEADQE